MSVKRGRSPSLLEVWRLAMEPDHLEAPMSGGQIERCPSCGRLIIHGQKCVCALGGRVVGLGDQPR